MGYPLTQNSATWPLLFAMVDSVDNISPKTGLTPTVTLSKNGTAFSSPAGAVTEVGNGWYKVAANASDVNALGPLVLHATATGANASDEAFDVLSDVTNVRTGGSYALDQSQTAQPLLFELLDAADHVTPLVGASPTVTLSKNGASFASPAGTVTEIGSGLYKVAPNATDTNTLGPLILHVTAVGADPSDSEYFIVGAASAAGSVFLSLYGAQLDIELGSADGGPTAGASNVLFTKVRRKQAINDAMHNFERITGCTKRYGSIPIVSGTGEYDLLAVFADYISIAENSAPAVKLVDPNGKVTYIQGDNLPYRTPEWLDREAPGWRADPAGTPASWYLRDDGRTYLGLDPAPSVPAGWTYSILFPYLARSADMVADSDQPFKVGSNVLTRLVPYYQALVHYAAALLEPLRKNYPGADRQMKLYAGYIAQYETKKLKDAPAQVTFARNYLREARGHGTRPADPRRFP